jgi:hypothetical protein
MDLGRIKRSPAPLPPDAEGRVSRNLHPSHERRYLKPPRRVPLLHRSRSEVSSRVPGQPSLSSRSISAPIARSLGSATCPGKVRTTAASPRIGSSRAKMASILGIQSRRGYSPTAAASKSYACLVIAPEASFFRPARCDHTGLFAGRGRSPLAEGRTELRVGEPDDWLRASRLAGICWFYAIFRNDRVAQRPRSW